MLLNSTSQSVAGAYGAMIHTAFLNDYLINSGAIKPTDPPLKV